MEFISVVELIGTVAFAITGALVAIDKDLDYYGIIALAIITAIGGGIVRDVLIGLDLPVSLENPIYAIISILTALAVIALHKKIERYHNFIQFFDAIGLAAFTAIGAEVAINNGLHQPFVIITLAVLTGTGGGMMRDVFAHEIPFVFHKEVYAVACIIGSVFFVILYGSFGNSIALYVCFGVTLLIRLYCMRKGIQLIKVRK